MKNYILEVDIPTGTRMRFGVPAEQPTLAMAALIELFSKMDQVVSARLGLMEKVSDEGVGAYSYTLGLQCSRDEEYVTAEVLRVLEGVPTGRWPIAIAPFEFFTSEAIVFYKRGETSPSSNTDSKMKHGWWSRLFSSLT
jgi:hypothetical protein